MSQQYETITEDDGSETIVAKISRVNVQLQFATGPLKVAASHTYYLFLDFLAKATEEHPQSSEDPDKAREEMVLQNYRIECDRRDEQYYGLIALHFQDAYGLDAVTMDEAIQIDRAIRAGFALFKKKLDGSPTSPTISEYSQAKSPETTIKYSEGTSPDCEQSENSTTESGPETPQQQQQNG